MSRKKLFCTCVESLRACTPAAGCPDCQAGSAGAGSLTPDSGICAGRHQSCVAASRWLSAGDALTATVLL